MNTVPVKSTGIRNARKQHLLHLDVHCDKVKVDEYLHFFGFVFFKRTYFSVEAWQRNDNNLFCEVDFH